MPNTIEENIERLKAVVPAIKNSIIIKGGTVNSGDGLEEFADDVLSIKNELTDISITSNGEYYSGEETTLTTTSFPVTVLDTVGTPLKHVDVIGNANQSGTPTPDNPIMPQGTGDNTRNLFPLDENKLHVGRIENNGTIDYEIGTITVGTDSVTYEANATWRGFYTDLIQVNENEKLTFSPNDSADIAWSCSCYDENGNFLGKASGQSVATIRTFTLLTGTKTVRMNVTSSSTVYAISQPMLNTGSTALPYEPYGIKIPISNDGENLFDGNYTAAVMSVSGNTATLNTTSSGRTAIVKCKSNTTYTVKKYGISNRFIITESDIKPVNGTVMSIIQNNSSISEYTFTTSNTTQYVAIYCSTSSEQAEPQLMVYHHITTPVYLGEVETVRYVKKLVLDGTEDFQSISSGNNKYFRLSVEDFGEIHIDTTYCTHFESVSITSSTTNVGVGVIHSSVLNKDALGIRPPQVSTTSLEDFTTYLTQQYNNGTPVTVWYVLATPTTGIVNEPLMRIGEYADELSIDTNIPLEQNTKNIINVDTTLKPSSASFTYNKKGTYIGYNKINVNVSNTYTVEDEGKVVDNAALVSQTAMPAEITVNDTYDTTLYNSIVVNVPSAPTPTPSVKSDVTFYDYDGTIVQSYSANDFANLSELPVNPTHEGLIAQGWNWSLADAKAYVANYGSLNIGQMYTTSDGKTRLHISLPEGRTSPILQLYLNDNSELDIDWGDGSTHSTFTSTSSDYKSERHEYSASGDYVIAITVVSGGFELQSSSTTISSILWNGNNQMYSPDRTYNNAIKKIEIGDNVTSIGDNAFYYCSSLSSITIPHNVTSISSKTFYYCYSLSSITIPDSVTSIGDNAFYYCSSLSSITISNGVTSISSNTFYYCYSLSSITIPDGVTSIGSNAFSSCYSLSSITIPHNVTSIGVAAFSSCTSLSSITISNGVTSIGNNAFSSCSSLSSITIPDSVTSIGNNAFSGCYSLSSIIISNGVTSISSKTFYYCYSLSSITIPDSVTSIGDNAFFSCAYMSYVKFESTTPPTVTKSNAWANVSTSTKILVPAGTLETYKSATNYPNPSTYTYEEY